MYTTLARHEHLTSLSPTITIDRLGAVTLRYRNRFENAADIGVQNAPIRFGFRAATRAVHYPIQHSIRWYENFISLIVLFFVCLALDGCSKQVRYRGTPSLSDP